MYATSLIIQCFAAVVAKSILYQKTYKNYLIILKTIPNTQWRAVKIQEGEAMELIKSSELRV